MQTWVYLLVLAAVSVGATFDAALRVNVGVVAHCLAESGFDDAWSFLAARPATPRHSTA